MQFCAAYGDYQFIRGHDDVAVTAADTRRLAGFRAQTGRDVGPYALYFVITGETDAVAHQKWAYYREGADLEAIAYMTGQANLDASGGTAAYHYPDAERVRSQYWQDRRQPCHRGQATR